ncbi:MAG: carbamoyltransferase HypF, partial [Caldilineae bacterium]
SPISQSPISQSPTSQSPTYESPPPSPLFEIRHSESQPRAFVPISPDMCICDDCLRELFDPADRRYRYPFINCTNCGPRFTIIRNIPYDRPFTTMAVFPMCPACQAEYDDPLNRRFHAQPNACPDCGPQVELRVPGEESRRGEEAIRGAQEMLAAGKIVAVKGLGGFHLACDATSDRALQTLRERKGRVDKPFAVMARDMDAVRRIARVSPAERDLLLSKERPIVLLKKRDGSPLSELVAPGNRYVGVMLPYTPLHYLLLTPRLPVLVMTSGNYSEEPIVKDNAEALERLASLADAFLLHNRDIHVHCDDSVVRVFEGRELPVRRSRGYAPFPVKLPFEVSSILAVGGELKNTFCLTRDRYAFMSQHIGDMENLETLQAFERAAAHFQAIFRVEPDVIACDMHPRYLSTRWAEEHAAGRAVVRVQHHHAHVAALMAEHGLDGEEPVIGFSFDGTGYGTDGAIWGGEVLLADYRRFTRAAHLKYVPLPGGDAAIKRPYRVALAHLWAAGVDWDERLSPVAACPPVERGVLRRQLETGFNTVPTSSMGRLFDAVASLAGVRQTITYEAQAAIEFEALLAAAAEGAYRFDLQSAQSDLQFLIDPAPVIRQAAADARAGVPAPVIAARFHRAVADLILRVSLHVRRAAGLKRVALTGGVFQNVTLLALATNALRAEGFEVLTHRRVPPNDGGLALGQA